MSPAVRPATMSAARGSAPQIRLIGKKPTMIGLQPQNARPSQSQGMLPSAPARVDSTETASVAAEHDSSPPEDARTIALASPAGVLRNAPPTAPPGLPSAAAGGASRPVGQGLPAGAKGSSPSGVSTSRAVPPHRRPIDALPSVASSQDGSDETKTKPLTAAEVASSSRGGAIEIGDAGMEDAELALEAMTSFRLAEAALQRNDLASAEEHASKAVDGDPTHADYVVLLAWIRALSGGPQKIAEAIRTMSRVLIEDPSHEQALFYRAKLLVRTNRLPEALNDFNELLSANPNHREAQSEARQLKAKLPR